MGGIIMKKIMFNDKYGLTQAVLEGRKTMTRRVCKYDRPNETYDIVFPVFEPNDYDNDGNIVSTLNYAFGWKNDKGDFTGWNIPKYKVGEVVAIAQSYESVYHEYGLETMNMLVSSLKYNAGWTNKMFVKSDLMPHHIEITGIKVERLQDISDEDCLKEGIIHAYTVNNGTKIYHTPHTKRGYLSTDVAQRAFADLIDKVSGKGTWEENPFVWVYEFALRF